MRSVRTREQRDLFLDEGRGPLDKLLRQKQDKHGSARRLALKALQGGAEQVSPGHLRWDVSGLCRSPGSREVYERGYRPDGRRENYWIELTIPCRKCPECLRFRAAHWRSAAMIEVGRHPATFFGTITQRPENHYRDLLAIMAACHEDRVSFTDLSPEQVFKERLRVISPKITAYQKRVRKQVHVHTGLRFFWVAEQHRSGLPHMHCLVHLWPFQPATEWDAYPTYAALRAHWHEGDVLSFSGVARDNPREVFYICKYLAKQSLARVRTSLRYGE